MEKRRKYILHFPNTYKKELTPQSRVNKLLYILRSIYISVKELNTTNTNQKLMYITHIHFSSFYCTFPLAYSKARLKRCGDKASLPSKAM
jgi:hypothetical protein